MEAGKKHGQPANRQAVRKRPKGIEPSITAWEAVVFPLHHGRPSVGHSTTMLGNNKTHPCGRARTLGLTRPYSAAPG